jgi:catechol 2,3-dioxygenase-like lactoylglutathione lyase family enzyme
VDIRTRSLPLQVSTALLTLATLTSAGYAQTVPERPPITGVANIAIRVANLDSARQFYSGTVGLTEAFETRQVEDASPRACFKVNDHQYVEVSPELKGETEDRLISIGFETTDTRKLRDYLSAKRVKVPAKVLTDPNGNLSFSVKDPDGHSVQFVQYMPGSIHSRNFGKHVSHKRLSDHILHVGIRVIDPVRADKFYKDVLNFRLMWKGGRTDTHFDWISMLVPDGHDWVEYMVTETDPTPQQLGVLHHYCLSTLDIQNTYKTVLERGYQPPRPPNIARDGRWLLQLYDNNYTRTELMVRKPVETPCCSPMTDDQ